MRHAQYFELSAEALDEFMDALQSLERVLERQHRTLHGTRATGGNLRRKIRKIEQSIYHDNLIHNVEQSNSESANSMNVLDNY